MKRYIKSAKVDYSKDANRRSIEKYAISEEAYNTLVEFANNLDGSDIYQVLNIKSGAYEIGVTCSSAHVAMDDEYVSLVVEFSPMKCLSDPNVQLRNGDDSVIVGEISSGYRIEVDSTKYGLPNGSYTGSSTAGGYKLHCTYSSDAEIYDSIDRFSDWLDHVDFDLDSISIVFPDTVDAIEYIFNSQAMYDIVYDLFTDYASDVSIIRDMVNKSMRISIFGQECDKLKIESRYFDSITIECPGGVTVEDIESIPDTTTLTFTSEGLQKLWHSTVYNLMMDYIWSEDDPKFSIPMGSWYAKDFGYEYIIQWYWGAIKLHLGKGIDLDFPFDSDIEVLVFEISSDNLVDQIIDNIGIDKLETSTDVVQVISDAIQSIINSSYNDTKFRKNLRAAFRRRAKSEGIIFSEEY